MSKNHTHRLEFRGNNFASTVAEILMVNFVKTGNDVITNSQLCKLLNCSRQTLNDHVCYEYKMEQLKMYGVVRFKSENKYTVLWKINPDQYNKCLYLKRKFN